MTTQYVQDLHTVARQEVQLHGRFSAATAVAFEKVGYDSGAIANLERKYYGVVLGNERKQRRS
jgi:hypothetical protein